MVNNTTYNKLKFKIYCNKTTKFLNISNDNMYKDSIFRMKLIFSLW